MAACGFVAQIPTVKLEQTRIEMPCFNLLYKVVRLTDKSCGQVGKQLEILDGFSTTVPSQWQSTTSFECFISSRFHCGLFLLRVPVFVVLLWYRHECPYLAADLFRRVLVIVLRVLGHRLQHVGSVKSYHAQDTVCS